MAAAGVDGDDETYEWLANAAVRGVDFVTVSAPHSLPLLFFSLSVCSFSNMAVAGSGGGGYSLHA